ncbi:MAG TPA: hypothetical protein VFV50_08775, partial [Bdellovibrionales bacterium]|nr:hypothetical protein [Bdellovibrionales bacterium]
QLGVGHQQFVRVPCTGTEELRFKFGAGTLEPARRAVIPNLRAHVGIAIRTEYDEVNLRGRGFIYIASDIGNETYDASNSIAQPWKHEIFLFLTLVHELGHVFGIPHTGPKYSLMSAQFLEMILHKTTAEPMKNFKIGESNVVPFFFFPSRYFVQCSQDGWLAEAVQVFQIPADTGCLHFGVDDDRGLIHVYGSKKPGAPEKPLGLISKLDFDAEPSLGVTLFLTPKQKVFAQMPNPYHLMTGPFFAAKKGSASFTPAGGGPARPLYLDLSPSTFTIVGLANGTLKTLLTGPMTMIPHY